MNRYVEMSSKGEHTADVRVYHYVQRPHPTPNLASPSVAMMLESEANYGLIAHFKQVRIKSFAPQMCYFEFFCVFVLL